MRLGNGANSSFWVDSWVGTMSFQVLYPRLFQVSEQKSQSVASCGNKWRIVGCGLLSGGETFLHGNRKF